MVKIRFGTVFTILILSISALSGNAFAASLNITQVGIVAENLVVTFEAEDFLDDRSIEFLNKGFTLQFSYTIELWRSRSFWFDVQIAQRKIEHFITFDLIKREYLGIRKLSDEEVSEITTYRIDRVIDWLTRMRRVELFDVGELDGKSAYYCTVNAELDMMTADDIEELRIWLNDIDAEASSEARSVTDVFLGLMVDIIASRMSKKVKSASGKFHIDDLDRIVDSQE